MLCIFDILDWQVFLVCLTIPLARDLYNSMVTFSTNSELVPDKKWYHFPMENLEAFEKVADGQATTILLPAELQGIASVAATLKETAK